MEEKQVPIEKEWLIETNQDFMTIGAAEPARWSKRSIYKIPTSFTDLNIRPYKPQIVSIGPYHHGAELLKEMEQHKHRALNQFLKRLEICLKMLAELLTPKVEDIKDAYDQLDSKWHQNTDTFLEMMILDDCFILKILRMNKNWENSHNEAAGDYAHNDPIFSYHGKLNIVPYLRRDMLMLENQIPMLVLEKLASVLKGDSPLKDRALMELVLNFLSLKKATIKLDECLHILEVHHRRLLLEESPHKSNHTYQPTKCCSLSNCSPEDDKRDSEEEIIRSATELEEAGISIKRSKSGSLRDISFRDGVLELPRVVVDDSLESLYLNLIAYERFHVGAGHDVTSYVFFMDNIIDNASDVSRLHSCGIIQNALGSDKAVANLFNSLSREATLDSNSHLDDVHKRMGA